MSALNCPKCRQGYASCQCSSSYASAEEKERKLDEIRAVKAEQLARVSDVIAAHEPKGTERIEVVLPLELLSLVRERAATRGISESAVVEDIITLYGPVKQPAVLSGPAEAAKFTLAERHVKRLRLLSKNEKKELGAVLAQWLARGLAQESAMIAIDRTPRTVKKAAESPGKSGKAAEQRRRASEQKKE